MAKNRNGDGKIEKSGYRPLNEGYSPEKQRGYAPKIPTGSLPKAPQGGTGENTKPVSTPAKGKK
jgi:hypothetical protein